MGKRKRGYHHWGPPRCGAKKHQARAALLPLRPGFDCILADHACSCKPAQKAFRAKNAVVEVLHDRGHGPGIHGRSGTYKAHELCLPSANTSGFHSAPEHKGSQASRGLRRSPIFRTRCVAVRPPRGRPRTYQLASRPAKRSDGATPSMKFWRKPTEATRASAEPFPSGGHSEARLIRQRSRSFASIVKQEWTGDRDRLDPGRP